MKMDAYINQFCKSLKQLIEKSRYRQVIIKCENFIEREKNSFYTFTKQTIIQLLYLQSYCCHKLILNQIFETNQNLNKRVIKQVLNVTLRNLKFIFKFISDFVHRQQILINFANIEQQDYNSKNNQFEQNEEITQKSFSQFLQVAIFLAKDLAILHCSKKDILIKDNILKTSIKFIESIDNTVLMKKKIRFRVNQLQVKCIYIVHLFKKGQYQIGQKQCQKTITQIFQFISTLTHKTQSKDRTHRHAKSLRKCYKLLFMSFIYQAFYHIIQGVVHPIQSLYSIIAKIQRINGPKQLIKYFTSYFQIMKLIQTIIMTHEQYMRQFGSNQIISIEAIYNIIENNEKNGQKSKVLLDRNTRKGFTHKKSKESLLTKQVNNSSYIDRTLQGSRRIQSQTKFKINIDQRKLFQQPSLNFQPCPIFSQSFSKLTNFNSSNCILNPPQRQQSKINTIILQQSQYSKCKAKRLGMIQQQAKNSQKHVGAQNKMFLNIMRNQNIQLNSFINRNLVKISQQAFENRIRNKKIELSRKKYQTNNTTQIFQQNKNQFEQINFDNDINRLWSQFKQSAKLKETQYSKQNRNKLYYNRNSQNKEGEDNQSQNNQQKRNIDIQLTKRWGKNKQIFTYRSFNNNKNGKQNTKSIINSIFELGKQFNGNKIGQKKSQTLIQKFIKILIKNKNALSIHSLSFKYQSHYKKIQNQRIRQFQKLNVQQDCQSFSIKSNVQMSQYSIKGLKSSENSSERREKKMVLNKMRTQKIVTQTNNKNKVTFIDKKDNQFMLKQQCINYQNNFNNLKNKTKDGRISFFQPENKEEKYLSFIFGDKPGSSTDKQCESLGKQKRHQRYVSKYIRNKLSNNSNCLEQITSPQYEKKLKFCYEKSLKSIQNITSKMIKKQQNTWIKKQRQKNRQSLNFDEVKQLKANKNIRKSQSYFNL